MVEGIQVTLAASATNYNLLSLILAALGYTVADTTKLPNVQVAIDGSKPFWPNPCRELQLAGDKNNGAGIITLKDKNGNAIFPFPANATELMRSQNNSIDLGEFLVSTDTNGSKFDVLVDSL